MIVRGGLKFLGMEGLPGPRIRSCGQRRWRRQAQLDPNASRGVQVSLATTNAPFFSICVTTRKDFFGEAPGWAADERFIQECGTRWAGPRAGS